MGWTMNTHQTRWTPLSQGLKWHVNAIFFFCWCVLMRRCTVNAQILTATWRCICPASVCLEKKKTWTVMASVFCYLNIWIQWGIMGQFFFFFFLYFFLVSRVKGKRVGCVCACAVCMRDRFSFQVYFNEFFLNFSVNWKWLRNDIS